VLPRVVGVAVVAFLFAFADLRAGARGIVAARACAPRPAVTARTITTARWVSGAVVTEYFPVRESWFSGRLVRAPGLRGRHRADWLYGPHGVAMNGEGLGRNGRFYHFGGSYDIDWANAAGAVTRPCWNGRWTGGKPAWLAFGWRNGRGEVTFPLTRGGWSNGRAARYVRSPLPLTFRPGRTRPQPFWRTVATEPRVIPLGSRVFIPAYCRTPARGWFTARDTGGAIIGFHVDVYRPPPRTLELRSLRDQKIYVVPPGSAGRAKLPRC
jgi:3D (Asp-Asp-Asp) domain-containing protein